MKRLKKEIELEIIEETLSNCEMAVVELKEIGVLEGMLVVDLITKEEIYNISELTYNNSETKKEFRSNLFYFLLSETNNKFYELKEKGEIK